MDSVCKAMCCKAKRTINLKPDPTILDTRDLILLLNLQEPWMLICALENRPFPLKYSTYQAINRKYLCECSFSARPYYLTQILL